jgi:hypothetical protein
MLADAAVPDERRAACSQAGAGSGDLDRELHQISKHVANVSRCWTMIKCAGKALLCR